MYDAMRRGVAEPWWSTPFVTMMIINWGKINKSTTAAAHMIQEWMWEKISFLQLNWVVVVSSGVVYYIMCAFFSSFIFFVWIQPSITCYTESAFCCNNNTTTTITLSVKAVNFDFNCNNVNARTVVNPHSCTCGVWWWEWWVGITMMMSIGDHYSQGLLWLQTQLCITNSFNNLSGRWGKSIR